MPKKVVIVGGVAGGAVAAARLRRLDEEAEITIIEKGEYVSYATCGLPYYIGGVIEDRNRLLVHTPEELEKRFNLEVRTCCKVVGIDRKNKEVTINDLAYDQSTRESYDFLLLAPGASPVSPPVKGAGRKNVFTLSNLADTQDIMDYLRSHKPHRAVIIGAGFIGLEMVENLVERGIRVSVVEKQKHVLPALDYDMAVSLHNYLRKQKVELFLETGVRAIENKEGETRVLLDKGGTGLPADFVIMAVGVSPNIELAEQAGLEIGETGGIKVDEYLRTSDKNIYAVGDAVQVKNYISGAPDHVPLAGPASKQGRVVANNIAGREEEYKGAQRTIVLKLFDMTAAGTGLTEEELVDSGTDYDVSYTSSYQHAGYYPGAAPLTIKLLFHPGDGKLLGAQVTGTEGVDKRIDVLSTALRYGKTVYDLQELELAYAPPFGAAKDPVNIAGFAAGNIVNNDLDTVHPLEIEDMDQEKVQLLDVRAEIEKRTGEIEGSISIPLPGLRGSLDRLDPERPVVVYCATGMRSYLACRILSQKGFDEVKNLLGGYWLYSLILADRNETVPEEVINAESGGREGITFASEPSENTSNEKNEKANQDADSDADNKGGKEKRQQDEADEEERVTEGITTVDVSGLPYPRPLLTVKRRLERLDAGEELKIVTSSLAQTRDILSLCRGLDLADVNSFSAADFSIVAEKVAPAEEPEAARKMSLIVFSGEFDRVAAALLLATTAAASGRNVNLFFTFWGVNLLKKNRELEVDEGFMKKMLSRIKPEGDSGELSLSRVGMLGRDPEFFRRIIENKGIESLDDLIRMALDGGVKLTACYMSMQLMGMGRDELIDGVEIKGYASYFSDNENHINMFV
ncbi:MAG: FAD-dependent oxidoreductase [Bacillota bacterium]